MLPDGGMGDTFKVLVKGRMPVPLTALSQKLGSFLLMKRITSIIFDLDGTLYTSSQLTGGNSAGCSRFACSQCSSCGERNQIVCGKSGTFRQTGCEATPAALTCLSATLSSS
jgi:hypothetical protein